MSRVFGIDPGLSGAIADLELDGSGATLALAVHDVPTFATRVGGKARRRLDIGGVLALLSARPDAPVTAAFLETVGPTPRDSRAGAFAFGEVYGSIRACVHATRHRLEQVTPQRWKKHFGLYASKDAARARAIALFPDHRELFARKCDDGRAEAALIALYGFRASKEMMK